MVGKLFFGVLLLIGAMILGMPMGGNAANEVAKLTTAPEVPPAITRPGGANVTVELETTEVKGQLADGVEYTYWTFGGTVPGPMIRVKVGDNITFTLKNSATSKNLHSIDFHAVTGPAAALKLARHFQVEKQRFSSRR